MYSLKHADTDTSATAQNAPRDACPEHLATLPTTQAVLKALQRACAAKHRILANQPPLEVETLWLQKHDKPRNQQDNEWRSQRCAWVASSLLAATWH